MPEPQAAVSVVLPTYNRAGSLARALESVLTQTFTDFELIVVDDGSTDGTATVVRSYEDRRVRCLVLPENRGVSAARNAGIEAATAPFIAFQDSDDMWLPEKLAKQMRAFVDAPERLGVVYTGSWRVHGARRGYFPPRGTRVAGDLHAQLLRRNIIGAPVAMVRRQIFARVGGFDAQLEALEDWDMFLRIAHDYDFGFVDEPLYLATMSTDSLTVDLRRQARALEALVRKHAGEYARHPVFLAGHIYTLGDYLCQRPETFSRGLRYLRQALRMAPTNPKFLAVTGIALLGPRVYRRFATRKRQLWEAGLYPELVSR